MNDKTTIQVSRKVRDKLEKLKVKNYNEVIEKLIDNKFDPNVAPEDRDRTIEQRKDERKILIEKNIDLKTYKGNNTAISDMIERNEEKIKIIDAQQKQSLERKAIREKKR